MKTVKLFISGLFVLSLLASACKKEEPTPPADFSCDAIQEQLDLSSFCGLDVNAHFNLLSPTDMTCSFTLSADAIASGAWPYDDFINFNISGFLTTAPAVALYQQNVDLAQDGGYDEVMYPSGIGTEAVAALSFDTDGNAVEVTVSFYKGPVIVSLGVGDLECFSENAVYELAKAIAALY